MTSFCIAFQDVVHVCALTDLWIMMLEVSCTYDHMKKLFLVKEFQHVVSTKEMHIGKMTDFWAAAGSEKFLKNMQK